MDTKIGALAIREVIYSTALKASMEPELMAMNYVDELSDFVDGDKYRQLKVGSLNPLKDRAEGEEIKTTTLELTAQDFEINQSTAGGFEVTDEFLQDSYISQQIISDIPGKLTTAFLQTLESNIFGIGKTVYEANPDLKIQGYRHFYVAGVNGGSAANTYGVVTPGDFAYASAALKKCGYTAQTVAIVSGEQARLMMDPVSYGAHLAFNPRWEGIIKDGNNSMTGLGYVGTIAGVDIYASEFLPEYAAVTEQDREGTEIACTDAVLAQMFSNVPGSRPYTMAWRQRPEIEGERIKKNKIEKYYISARYGLNSLETNNLVGMLMASNPDSTFAAA